MITLLKDADILILGFIFPVVCIFMGIFKNDMNILASGIIGVFACGIVILAMAKTRNINK